MTIEQYLRTGEVLEAPQLLETSEELNIAVSPTSKLSSYSKRGVNVMILGPSDNIFNC
jgi:hypothetical protein